jgi:calcineurin-like phosphoesterase family protein
MASIDKIAKELWVKNDDGTKQHIMLSHYAFYVWAASHKGSWNLFGHSHGSLDKWAREGKRMDVGIDGEFTNFAPISYDKVKKIMDARQTVFVDHHDKDTNIR